MNVSLQQNPSDGFLRWLQWRADGLSVPLFFTRLDRYTEYLERYTKLATPVWRATGSQELFGAWACEDVALYRSPIFHKYRNI